MRCYTFLRNVTDIQHHGTIPYVARYGVAFTGHKIPFGAEVGYLKFGVHTKVIREQGQSFARKTHRALFLSYDVRPGGLWSGDSYVVDADTIHNADSLQSVKALRVKDVVMPEYFVFPLATGAIKQPEDLRQRFELEDDGMQIPFEGPEIEELEDFAKLKPESWSTSASGKSTGIVQSRRR